MTKQHKAQAKKRIEAKNSGSKFINTMWFGLAIVCAGIAYNAIMNQPAAVAAPVSTIPLEARSLDHDVRVQGLAIPGFSIDGLDIPVSFTTVPQMPVDLNGHIYDKSVAIN